MGVTGEIRDDKVTHPAIFFRLVTLLMHTFTHMHSHTDTHLPIYFPPGIKVLKILMVLSKLAIKIVIKNISTFCMKKYLFPFSGKRVMTFHLVQVVNNHFSYFRRKAYAISILICHEHPDERVFVLAENLFCTSSSSFHTSYSCVDLELSSMI